MPQPLRSFWQSHLSLTHDTEAMGGMDWRRQKMHSGGKLYQLTRETEAELVVLRRLLLLEMIRERSVHHPLPRREILEISLINGGLKSLPLYRSELTRYLQEQPIDSTADPLAWWRDNETRYPLLAKLARKYMCICATSTASERVFSTAGNIATPVRSSLKPSKVNMLVFLSRNLEVEKD